MVVAAAHTAGGTQQNHNILRLHRAEPISVPDQGAPAEHGLDFLRHEGGFLVVGILPDLQGIELHAGVGQRCAGTIKEIGVEDTAP